MIGLGSRFEAKSAPVCEEFNAAVMARAKRCVPMGWHAAYHTLVPYDLPSLNAAVNASVSLPVMGPRPAGSSVFGDDGEHEMAYQAWSMAMCYKFQLKPSLSGHAQIAYAQAWEMFTEHGTDYTVLNWVTMILCEQVGVAYYKLIHGGDDPGNRKAFSLKHATFYKRLAAMLATRFYAGMTQRQFVKEAKATWG